MDEAPGSARRKDLRALATRIASLKKQREGVLSKLQQLREPKTPALQAQQQRVSDAHARVAAARAKLEEVQKRNKESGLPTIQGPKGGRYYISNVTGEKVYVK